MDQETYGIIGAELEFHKRLGPEFLEAVYQEALSIEMAERGIPFFGEVEIPVFYKSKKLKLCAIDRISFAMAPLSLHSKRSHS